MTDPHDPDQGFYQCPHCKYIGQGDDFDVCGSDDWEDGQGGGLRMDGDWYCNRCHKASPMWEHEVEDYEPQLELFT